MERLKGSSADNPWTLDERDKLVLTKDLKAKKATPIKGKENAKKPPKYSPSGTRLIIYSGPPSTIIPHVRQAPGPAVTVPVAGASRSESSIRAARVQATSAPLAPRKTSKRASLPNRDSSPFSLDPPDTANNAKAPLRLVKYKPDVGRPGRRYPRDAPLIVDDLYVDEQRPHKFETDLLKPHHKCGLCKQIKSHPVSYQCGHSHCYVCIRLRLETDWTCPDCAALIEAKPIRHYGEEEGLEVDYPQWVDQSRVWYDWYGLAFPRAPR